MHLKCHVNDSWSHKTKMSNPLHQFQSTATIPWDHIKSQANPCFGGLVDLSLVHLVVSCFTGELFSGYLSIYGYSFAFCPTHLHPTRTDILITYSLNHLTKLKSTEKFAGKRPFLAWCRIPKKLPLNRHISGHFSFYELRLACAVIFKVPLNIK